MIQKKGKIESIIQELNSLIKDVMEAQKSNEKLIHQVHEKHEKSAKNLLHYRSLRSHDLRSLQKKLRNIGLSRLARSEAHVLASLLNTRYLLSNLITDGKAKKMKSGLSIKNGKKQLVSNTKDLLGYRSKGRRVRIMVTQPSESASNYPLVLEMVKNGMNCARVNCAHDDAGVWFNIISNVKRASKQLERPLRLLWIWLGLRLELVQSYLALRLESIARRGMNLVWSFLQLLSDLKMSK